MRSAFKFLQECALCRENRSRATRDKFAAPCLRCSLKALLFRFCELKCQKVNSVCHYTCILT